VERMGEEIKVYKVLVGKPEEKRPFEIPRGGWDQNGSWGDWIWGGGDWIRLAQDRDQWRTVVSAVMNLRVLAPRS
jgi:hypothetical protein